MLPNLTSSDLFILVLYLLSVLIIGFSLRSNIKSAKDFLQAGRSLPTWVCTLAFLAASLGSVEVVAMGAAGAQFGPKAIPFFVAGSVPALLFSAIYMIPLYFGSGARTVPEYLGLRFDRKTRLLQAGLFALGTLLSAGLSLYLMARLLQALRVFDFLFFSYGWPRQGIFTFCLLLPAAVVLAYVLFSGLAGAMVNQALQFALLVACLLPVVFKGLENIGGWSGLTTTLQTVYPLMKRASPTPELPSPCSPAWSSPPATGPPISASCRPPWPPKMPIQPAGFRSLPRSPCFSFHCR